MRKVSVNTIIVACFFGFLLLCCLPLLFILTRQTREDILAEAERDAQTLLDHNLAIHAFYAHNLKPDLFKAFGALGVEPEFDPVWMSSSYAVRTIFDLYNKGSKNTFYYKECAINARSPRNEADAFERSFIERLNADPDAPRKISLVRTIDGEQYLCVLMRGETMEESCLRCHSRPESAPRGMITVYGDERSFNRRNNEVVSAISIRAPIQAALSGLNQRALKLFLVFLACVAASAALLYLVVRALLIVPVAGVAARSAEICRDDACLGVELPLPRSGRELVELTGTFNLLTRKLRAMFDELESTVRKRTSRLAEANARLQEDLTEKDELNAQLVRLKDLAESANTAKSEFLANMSHEIRTPMNGVMGMLQLLEVTSEDPEQREMVGVALTASERLLALLDDILDLSRIETGAVSLSWEPVQAAKLVGEILAVFSAQCEKKGVRLESDIAQFTFLGDHAKLRQVLFNLVGNAVKFTASGTVRVSAWIVREDPLGGMQVLFSVTDEGIGIADEAIDKIFEPFTQEDGALTRKYGGTGLGLAIVKRLVALMGGTLCVASEKGLGTTIMFTAKGRRAGSAASPSPEEAT